MQRIGKYLIDTDKRIDGAIAATNDEVAALVAKRQTKSPKELLDERLALIQKAGRAYLYAQIDADGIALVERLVAVGHPYGIANSQWCVGLRKDQYLRMAQLEAGVVNFSPALLDFRVHGDKPYTVVQMMMAAGL